MFNFQSGSSKMVIILLSRVWGAALSIILVPVYVKLLGIESYGLVAFYAILAGALAILDVGLSASIIRQVAIYKTQPNKEKQLKNLVFTVEVLNWLIAIVVGIGIIALANPIATHWVKAKDLPVNTIQHCVMLMGAIFAVQFPASVYDGAMVGLQKQNANAILNLVFTTLKAVGVLVVLYFIQPRIELYFIWQAIVTLIYTLAMRWYVNKKINVAKFKAHFSTIELKIIWRFAAGIVGISLVTFFITQIDKIVVSQNLEQLSYYSLAFLLASGISAIISPMHSIIYPKLTQLIAIKDNSGLIKLYHKSCKWISIIVFPIGLTLIAFAKEIVFLWTNNVVLTNETTPILKVIVLGTIFNSLMVIPYNLTLAKGNTKYGLYQNTITAIIIVPLLFWLYTMYGALGASFVWLVSNALIVFISIPILHRMYFKNEIWRWLKIDVLLPLLLSSLIVICAKYIQHYFLQNINFFYFTLLISFMIVAYALITPEIRAYFKAISRGI
jgi:O-antigen/teichoic acid export membrane protein